MHVVEWSDGKKTTQKDSFLLCRSYRLSDSTGFVELLSLMTRTVLCYCSNLTSILLVFPVAFPTATVKNPFPTVVPDVGCSVVPYSSPIPRPHPFAEPRYRIFCYICNRTCSITPMMKASAAFPCLAAVFRPSARSAAVQKGMPSITIGSDIVGNAPNHAGSMLGPSRAFGHFMK